MKKNLLLFFIISCIELNAQICFSPKTDYTTAASGLGRLIAIDLNHDNSSELITTNSSSNNISVWPANGNGTFGMAASYTVNSNPEYMCSGDFNNDGNPDLALTYYWIDSFSVFPGNGSGGFGPKSDFPVSPGPKSIASADFNNDGNQDLAIATGMNAVDILTGNGAGGFSAPASFPVMNGPLNVVIADFNSDSKTDIIVNSVGSYCLSLLAGDGMGSFAPAIHIPTAYQPYFLSGGDVNTDGNTDLIIIEQNVAGLSLRLGDGAGNFPAGPGVATSGVPFLSDLDGDGAPELILSRYYSDSLHILKNDGTGNFSWVLNCKAYFDPADLCAADFNADGKNDLAVINSATNRISVFLNCSPVGLEKAMEEDSFSFYPNPANDVLQIHTGTAEEYSIDIRDLNSKSIRKQKIRSSTTLDLSDLGDGVYLLSVQGRETSFTKKLVILH